jgi:UDP:flavonoid glycosyltransferase YjiC (YdhE family)
MHALLIPFGTAGDVLPFIGVAIALRRRGHDVTVFTDVAFEDVIRRNGIEFACLSSREEYADLLKHPDLWHPTRSYPLIFKNQVAPKIRPVYEFIRENHVRGKTVVIAANLAVGARLACEHLGLPMVSLYVSPMCFRSYVHPPPLPGLDLFPGRPHAWIRTLFAIADWRVDRLLGPSLNGLRRELGMPPVKTIMDWWHSPQLIVGLFPEWFAPLETEWPQQTRLTGFPLYDTAGPTEISRDLEAFLQAGPPPVVFMPSSFMAQGAEFLRESVEACTRLQCRGILLTQFSEQVPALLPPGVRTFPFVPLSVLLPRSSAIVHQAGIGTIALALASGTPQLAVPMAMDQLANAERLQKLGTGIVMTTKEYRAESVASHLTQLLQSDGVRASCQQTAKRFIHARPVEDASDLIESVSPTSSVAS